MVLIYLSTGRYKTQLTLAPMDEAANGGLNIRHFIIPEITNRWPQPSFLELLSNGDILAAFFGFKNIFQFGMNPVGQFQMLAKHSVTDELKGISVGRVRGSDGVYANFKDGTMKIYLIMKNKFLEFARYNFKTYLWNILFEPNRNILFFELGNFKENKRIIYAGFWRGADLKYQNISLPCEGNMNIWCWSWMKNNKIVLYDSKSQILKLLELN